MTDIQSRAAHTKRGADSFYARYMKRLLDITMAVIMSVLLLAPMLVISIVAVVCDGFPVLYSQMRVGCGGKPFRIYKFRSMSKNAERIGPSYTLNDDPRITPIGRILRATSMDELPQLFNILKGDMSFIGYRPGIPENYSAQDYESGILDVRPGLTGYAQVNGRSRLTLEEKRAWERRYVQEVSFRTDLMILWKTFFIVLNRQGVN